MLGLQWGPFSFAIILLHSKLINTPISTSAVFLFPLLVVELFICISLWWVCKNLPLVKGKIINVMSIHHFSTLLIVGVWILIGYIYSRFLSHYLPNTDWVDIFISSLPLLIALGIFLYLISCFLYYVTIIFEKNQEAQRNVIEQKLHAAQTELKALKSTINPHSLFNSLTALNELIKKSPPEASRMCMTIADFLRYTVRHSEENLVHMEDELEHIKSYLEIEKIRLGDRLRVNIKADKKTLKMKVPPLILLPLIENAIKHGISQIIEGGKIDIIIEKISAYRLKIEVINPREECSKGTTGESKGLDTLRRRIEAFYGADARLIITKNSNSFEVKMVIPAL